MPIVTLEQKYLLRIYNTCSLSVLGIIWHEFVGKVMSAYWQL